MSSILQEIQADCLNKEINVSDLLRKAKIIASKLSLNDFLSWIEKELNGYDPRKEEIPQYRMIPSQLKGFNPNRGWQVVMFDDVQTAEIFSRRGVTSPISEIDSLVKSDSESFAVVLTPQAKEIISKALNFQTDVSSFVAKNSMVGILDAVRNEILDWILKLEKAGVKGEGISFSVKDEVNAQKVSTIYNISHFAGTIGSVSDNANINVNQVNNISIEEVNKLLEQIKKFGPSVDLSQQKRNEFDAIVSQIEVETKSTAPEHSKIKTLLLSARNIIEGAAGNIVADGIIMGIQKIMGF